MNKDTKGLVLYIAIFFVMAILCPFLCLDITFGPLWDDIPETAYFGFGKRMYAFFEIILSLLFAVYLITTPLITHLAIKNNWSKYLTWFFNKIWLHIVVLIALPCLVYLLNKAPIYINGTFMSAIILLIPTYFLIFLTIIFEKISKRISEYFKDGKISRKDKDVVGLFLCLFLFFVFGAWVCLLFSLSEYNIFFIVPEIVISILILTLCIQTSKRALKENWSRHLPFVFSHLFFFVPIFVNIFKKIKEKICPENEEEQKQLEYFCGAISLFVFFGLPYYLYNKMCFFNNEIIPYLPKVVITGVIIPSAFAILILRFKVSRYLYVLLKSTIFNGFLFMLVLAICIYISKKPYDDGMGLHFIIYYYISFNLTILVNKIAKAKEKSTPFNAKKRANAREIQKKEARISKFLWLILFAFEI